MREFGLQAFQALRLAACSALLALCIVLCGMAGTAQADDYSYDFDLTDIDGNSILNGGSFDADVLNQGLYLKFWQYSGYVPAITVTITDTADSKRLCGGGMENTDAVENIFLNPKVNYTGQFIGGHTYEIKIRLYTWEKGHPNASNYEIEIASYTYSLGTASEEPPADEDDDDDQTGSDDSGTSGSQGGSGDSGQNSDTDSAGSDSATGAGGDDATDDNSPAAPSFASDGQQHGSEAAASGRTSMSQGLDDTTERSGSNSSGGTPTLRQDQLAQLGTVYKVGELTDVSAQEESDEPASTLQAVQFSVYGIPLLILLLGIVFFGALPAGALSRFGVAGFGSRRHSRLG